MPRRAQATPRIWYREVVSESTVARDQGVKRQDYDRANTGSAAPSRGAWYPLSVDSEALWETGNGGTGPGKEPDRRDTGPESGPAALNLSSLSLDSEDPSGQDLPT